jgi:putative transposase
MTRKRHTEEQIIAVLKDARAGIGVQELCRKHGISDATFYKWRAKYAGLEVSDVKKLRQLEDENRRLKQTVAEQALEIQGAHLHFIHPVKPIQNAFIESFNGKFRDECLNEHWFLTLQEAQLVIEAGRGEYNEERTHSTIGDVTPQEFIINYQNGAHRVQEVTSSALE